MAPSRTMDGSGNPRRSRAQPPRQIFIPAFSTLTKVASINEGRHVYQSSAVAAVAVAAPDAAESSSSSARAGASAPSASASVPPFSGHLLPPRRAATAPVWRCGYPPHPSTESTST